MRLAVHDLAEFGGFGFKLGSLAGDSDDLRCHAWLKLQVDADTILNVHLHRARQRLP